MATEVNKNKFTDINFYKKAKKLVKDKTMDNIISKLVLLHKSIDDQLKEISDICSNKKEEDVR